MIDNGRLKLCSAIWTNAGSIYVLKNASKSTALLRTPETGAGATDMQMVMR